MGLIADLKDVSLRDKVEAGPRRLEVVDGLSHIAFGREDECGETLVVELDLALGGFLRR